MKELLDETMDVMSEEEQDRVRTERNIRDRERRYHRQFPPDDYQN